MSPLILVYSEINLENFYFISQNIDIKLIKKINLNKNINNNVTA